MYPGQQGYPPQGAPAPGIGFAAQGGGYPPQQQNNSYPPQQPSQPGYPPAQPGYPPSQHGYPPQQPNPGYPAQQQSYPYPAQQTGYPSYPPQQATAYPPQQNQAGYSPQQAYPTYPPQQNNSYPPQQSQGYPAQQAQAYPQASQQTQGYPAQQHNPSYPAQQPMNNNPYAQPGSMPHQTAMGQFGGGGLAHGGMSSVNRGQGTIKAWPGFNATADCQAIKKAMKGLGCDSKSILNILCQRSSLQRTEIRRLFKTMYGKDMIEELVSELRGKLEDVIVALVYSPAEYDAKSLRFAMDGIGTNEAILVEILSSRTNKEIHEIRAAYKFLYGRDLEKDVANETSYSFKRLCISLLQGGRDESSNTDALRANQDARSLYQAGEKKIGTDESTFNAICCAQNFAQLRLVFQEYQKVSGHDIEKAIQSEFSGDVEDGLLAVIKVAKNAAAFFAERLYMSMKGMGTKDHQLIRCVVTRCEVDMVQIKQEFQKLYGKSLESFISGDCSGHYKEALITLVKGN